MPDRPRPQENRGRTKAHGSGKAQSAGQPEGGAKARPAGSGNAKAARTGGGKARAASDGKAQAAGQPVADGKAGAAGQPASAVAQPDPGAAPAASGETSPRLAVRKTYKLFIGGAFPRSESGRSYPATGPGGVVLAHVAQASRKDARDAVVAARKAVAGWAGATAYNRGQVLYRVAELLEGRSEQFAAACVEGEGVSWAQARQSVSEAVDRWVWYAGWPDKVAQVAGGANPVAGPYFNFSVPEPTGVVAVIAPASPGLLGLVSVLAPVIATGNTAVVVASETAPLPAVTLAEVLATSDVPPGVVNVLTGRTAELAPVLAAHMDVNAVDLTGVAAADRAGLERLAAGNVKRVFASDDDWAADPGPARLLAFLETKTVWHPIGM